MSRGFLPGSGSLEWYPYGDLRIRHGFCSPARSGQELVKFETHEEVVFIRGYIAYDRLVRAPCPTRDGC
jgi:hypothetical protein